MSRNPYRGLPSVARLLDHPASVALRDQFSRDAFASAVRAELDILRSMIASGSAPERLPDDEVLVARAADRLARDSIPRIRPVINATGVILHPNLGRSPLHETAALAAYEAGRGYLSLELDLDSGKRSSRQLNIRLLMCRLTGAESATAVNNCAAATVLVLRALAQGKEVIVSRGQLIEIGGSFRLPEILGVSGAILREVGTTNITRIADYEKAISPNTGLLMRIHTSNYRVRGFVKSVDIGELAALGRKHNVPVVDDAGSGAAFDFSRFGLGGEPRVSDGLKAGADLVLFSGDKLLGGPQAGIIAGRAPLVRRIEKDPLMRAVRLDKMTLAALDATLRLYEDPVKAIREVPTLRMLSVPTAELRARAERLAEQVRTIDGVAEVELLDDVAYVGGGSLPDRTLPAVLVAVRARELSDTGLSRRLRTGRPAVIGRLHEGRILLDLRTVFDRQERELLEAIRTAVRPIDGESLA
jgi:L-seryl-tRNA(Ser) seleniumtransferase